MSAPSLVTLLRLRACLETPPGRSGGSFPAPVCRRYQPMPPASTAYASARQPNNRAPALRREVSKQALSGEAHRVLTRLSRKPAPMSHEMRECWAPAAIRTTHGAWPREGPSPLTRTRRAAGASCDDVDTDRASKMRQKQCPEAASDGDAIGGCFRKSRLRRTRLPSRFHPAAASAGPRGSWPRNRPRARSHRPPNWPGRSEAPRLR